MFPIPGEESLYTRAVRGESKHTHTPSFPVVSELRLTPLVTIDPASREGGSREEVLAQGILGLG